MTIILIGMAGFVLAIIVASLITANPTAITLSGFFLKPKGPPQ